MQYELISRSKTGNNSSATQKQASDQQRSKLLAGDHRIEVPKLASVGTVARSFGAVDIGTLGGVFALCTDGGGAGSGCGAG